MENRNELSLAWRLWSVFLFLVVVTTMVGVHHQIFDRRPAFMIGGAAFWLGIRLWIRWTYSWRGS